VDTWIFVHPMSAVETRSLGSLSSVNQQFELGKFHSLTARAQPIVNLKLDL
jgi:hypothetical protein